MSKSQQKLNIYGIILLVGTFIGPFIQGAILFACAKTINIPRGWLFIACSFVGMFGGIAIIAIKNPELVNQRGRWKKIKGSKRWDKFWIPIYGIIAFYITPAVIGIDFAKFNYPHLGSAFAVLGSLFYMSGQVLLHWAMLVNKHFEVTVRIQNDRDHTPVTKGPYKVVRHPGYVGALLWTITPPMIVGSSLALIPAALACLLLIFRTWLEDKTLQRELPGYCEYTKKVRYRLFSGIW